MSLSLKVLPAFFPSVVTVKAHTETGLHLPGVGSDCCDLNRPADLLQKGTRLGYPGGECV